MHHNATKKKHHLFAVQAPVSKVLYHVDFVPYFGTLAGRAWPTRVGNGFHVHAQQKEHRTQTHKLKKDWQFSSITTALLIQLDCHVP